MRDEAGTYIGVPDCKYYRGISHTTNRTCCGGKGKVIIAFITCQLRGLLEAETSCTMYACERYDGKQGKRS